MVSPPPDLAPVPATATNTDAPFDEDAAFAKWVDALVQVQSTEVTLAKRALVRRVRAAIFNAAEPGGVPLGYACAIDQVRGEVLLLATAGFALANGLVAFD
ncbi:MAG: hypothetical protein ACKVVT_02800 [Dehalococcoidia bacterium]